MAAIVAIREDELDVGSTATQVPTPISAEATTLIFIANNANTDTVYLGSSSVSTSGPNMGFDLAAGDRVIVPIDGPGASEFYFIRTVPAGSQKVTVQQWG